MTDQPLNFSEWQDEVSLADIQREIARFLSKRDDYVIIGAQAVNLLCPEDVRATADVDILTNDRTLFTLLFAHLLSVFHINLKPVDRDFMMSILRTDSKKSQYIFDCGVSRELPPAVRIDNLIVATRDWMIKEKRRISAIRAGTPKGDTDARDLKVLLGNQ